MSTATGPSLVLDHLLELLVVLALVVLCLLLGLMILDRAGGEERDRPVAVLLFAVAVGAGAYGAAVLVAGIAGLLAPWHLALLTVALAVSARSRLGRALRLLERCSREVTSRWDLLAFAALGLVALGMLAQASAPVTDWDSLIYHLEVPRAWLAEGRVHLPADNLHAAYTGLAHLLYVPLLAIGAESGPAVLSAVFGCLAALALFELGDRFFDRLTGRIAMVALFGSASVTFVAMTPRVDVTLTLFLTLGLYALFAARFGESDEEGGRRALLLAAAVLGLASSLKLLALPWIAAVAPLGLWTIARRSDGTREALRTAGMASSVFLLAAAPGLLLRWHLTGAPLYPYFSPRAVEPWLRPWYGTAVLPSDVVLQPRASFTRDPVSLWALLWNPGGLTPEREGSFYFLSPLLWLTPLVLFRLREERTSWLGGAAAIFLVLVLGPGMKANLRYLLPAVAALTLLCAHLLSWAYGRMRPGLVRRCAVGAVLTASLLPLALPFVLRWSEMPTLAFLSGAVSEETYLTENANPDVHLWARTAGWLDRTLEEGGRVLMLFEGRGYRLAVPKIQDNLMANWPLLAQRRESGDCLARGGITHVLVNYGVLDVHLSHGMSADAVAWSEFPAFARGCLDRVVVRSPYALYRVLPEAEPSIGRSPDDTGSHPP